MSASQSAGSKPEEPITP
ncbi:DUF1378 family protein [Escherichia coli]|nr:DUF1378 family protein [Escherichia coli]MCW3229066.1 DUF1378 family protein [Escherichia coli]